MSATLNSEVQFNSIFHAHFDNLGPSNWTIQMGVLLAVIRSFRHFSLSFVPERQLISYRIRSSEYVFFSALKLTAPALDMLPPSSRLRLQIGPHYYF